MKFNIIACINYNKAIGWKKTNNLIFSITGELASFKKITTEVLHYNDTNIPMNIIVMGRKTWDSLPPNKPLLGRYNCVISSNFKELNQKYKENKLEKYTCSCGIILGKNAKSAHEKTKKHQTFLKLLQDGEHPL